MQAAEAVDRRGQIVSAATAVLARQGYESTSMKEIANEAGVSSGLVHYYFGSKEELLAEVVRSWHQVLMSEWRASMAGVEDPLERIVAGTRQAAEKSSTSPEFWQLMFDLSSIGPRNELIRPRLLDMAAEFIGYLAEEARLVSGDRAVPSLVEADDLAMAVAGAVNGIALMSILTGRAADGAYRALAAMLIAYAALSFESSGNPVPVERIRELLGPNPQ
jgi:AcrR family transcriptional regulator